MNRLNLDFSLKTSKERSDFLSSYLPTLSFPTKEELELCTLGKRRRREESRPKKENPN